MPLIYKDSLIKSKSDKKSGLNGQEKERLESIANNGVSTEDLDPSLLKKMTGEKDTKATDTKATDTDDIQAIYNQLLQSNQLNYPYSYMGDDGGLSITYNGYWYSADSETDSRYKIRCPTRMDWWTISGIQAKPSTEYRGITFPSYSYYNPGVSAASKMHILQIIRGVSGAENYLPNPQNIPYRAHFNYFEAPEIFSTASDFRQGKINIAKESVTLNVNRVLNVYDDRDWLIDVADVYDYERGEHIHECGPGNDGLVSVSLSPSESRLKIEFRNEGLLPRQVGISCYFLERDS